MNWQIIENPPFADDAFSQKGDGATRWEQLKQHLPFGAIVTGTIYSRAPFGVFYDAGLGFPVLMEVPYFGKPGMEFPKDYPDLNSIITGQLAGFDDSNRQVRVVNVGRKLP